MRPACAGLLILLASLALLLLTGLLRCGLLSGLFLIGLRTGLFAGLFTRLFLWLIGGLGLTALL